MSVKAVPPLTMREFPSRLRVMGKAGPLSSAGSAAGGTMKRSGRRHGAGRILLALAAAWIAAGGRGEASEPGKEGPSEGIKVHGHWTIEVRNPDGSLASAHEFQNALVTSTAGGDSLLSGLLSNYYSDPIWTVSLYGPNTTGPCRHDTASDMWPCRVTEPRSPFSGGEYSKNLVVDLPVAGPGGGRPAGTFGLSGSATAVHDGAITQVDTAWYVTARNHFGGLTMKALPSPIQVRAGQIIQVKVVVSFS